MPTTTRPAPAPRRVDTPARRCDTGPAGGLRPGTALLALALAGALGLAGCARYGGGTPAPAEPPPPVPAAPAAIELPPPAPPAPPVAPPVLSAAELNRLATTARELLLAGNEEAARAELQRVLAADPNHALARLLMRQITEDPVRWLGRESHAYTVRPGDSLSKLARLYLNDFNLFYILARYNGIKEPSVLPVGQVVRMPGRTPPAALAAPAPTPAAPPPPAAAEAPPPPPAAAPEAPPPAAAEADRLVQRGKAVARSGDFDGARKLFQQAADLGHAEAPRLAEDARQRLVQRHAREARVATARQDLDGAIRQWEKVLELDPGNDTASLELRKTRALKAKAAGL